MKYKTLKQEGMRQLLEQRRANVEAEHYGHTVTIELLKLATDVGEDEKLNAIEQEEKMMARLDEVHRHVSDMIRSLDAMEAIDEPA